MKKLVLALLSLVCMATVAGASVHNVRDYGAKGDGVTIDSPAIDAAIKAASEEGGGMVYFPAGKYASYSIHLASHIHLYLEEGSIIYAAEGEGFDPAEPGPQPQYQDFGHSHWQNSLIWGIGLEDITISGPGLIDGSNLSPGYGDHAVKDGVGNKSISLKNCRRVVLKDFKMIRSGHFALLATGVDDMVIDGLVIDTNRDGLDVDCCRNVRISNCNVNSPFDDGIVLKASYALDRYVDTRDVVITNCHMSGYDVGSVMDATYTIPTLVSPHTGTARLTRSAGRLKLGTETSGGFKNIVVSNCSFDLCGGIVVESMDGGIVEGLVFSNLVMRDCLDSPIFFRIGQRMRSPEGIPVGTIRNVLISDLDAASTSPYFGVIFAGLPGHNIKDVTMRNIRLDAVGGIRKEDAIKTVPEREKAYPDPDMFSGDKAMPMKGMMIRHAEDIVMDGVTFSFQKKDTRPLFYMDDAKRVIRKNVRILR